MVYPGHIKFWKKKGMGIEFVKHFRSHLGPICGLAVSFLGILLTEFFQPGLFFLDIPCQSTLDTKLSSLIVEKILAPQLNSLFVVVVNLGNIHLGDILNLECCFISSSSCFLTHTAKNPLSLPDNSSIHQWILLQLNLCLFFSFFSACVYSVGISFYVLKCDKFVHAGKSRWFALLHNIG